MPAPTITSIRQLRNVGIFADCAPASFPYTFKKHNLIYGFNGSGKTTLSRLIDSIGERGISPKLGEEAHFCFELSDGSKPDASSPASAASRFIAVFNEDYIERSLAWSQGTAEAIIYVGEEQTELAKQLEILENQERDEASTEALAGTELSASERELANITRDVARLIAEELGLGRTYNAANLKADYASASYGPDDRRSDSARTNLRQTINQTDLPDKLSVTLRLISPSPTTTMAKACLETSLAQLTLESLERRKDALQWVADNKSTFDAATLKLSETRGSIQEIRSKLRTHGPAAAAMNQILRGYLGHEEIELIANEEGYQLSRRGSLDPKPLSEGEKTAVAFCHFLATLRSEGRKHQDFIVVLDDPISSLDARAMTHAVALIKQWFGEPLQLFVLTHNLEFMREIKKWLQRKYEDDVAEFLFVETSVLDGVRQSSLVKMPKLIREYESEYHYLYSLVKNLADEPADFAKFAYLMPNALRKVLDIFLAFKIPGGAGLSSKVDKLIQDYPALDSARVKAMEQLAHLESHSESIGDVTTFSAFTLEQISDAADCLMKLIEIVDPGHKKAMDRLCR